MILILVFASTLILDQVTKAFALIFLPFSLPQPLFGNFLFLTLTANRGAAFGMLPWAFYLFLVLSSAVIVGSFLFFKKLIRLPTWYQIACGMILGGAAGNLLDRLTYGIVVEFIDFRFWPVFNLADSSIVLGGILLTGLLLFQKKWK
jgi:signal peptidase II